jgi:glycosyltransferase involved in cell wall biosynthesis
VSDAGAREPWRVTYVIGELGKGGAEYQLVELLRGLDRRRFVPTVVSLSAGGYWAEAIREMGIVLHHLPQRRRVEFARLRGLRGLLQQRGAPHLLHTILWSGNAYGRLAALGLGIPVILAAERNVVRRPAWQVGLERGLDRWTTAYLVNAAAVADEMCGRGGLPRAKMHVVPNGIDLTQLPPYDEDRQAARARLGFDPRRRLVAQVGRLVPQKDHATWLRAVALVARQVPDVDFLIVGEGPQRPELERLAQALGVAERVRFLGLRHDVPALLAGADVATLTSRWEGLPNVVIEAMAMGAAVVATDVGGCGELVGDDEAGRLVPMESPEAVARALRELLDDEAERRRCVRAARRRVEAELTVERMVGRTETLYGDLLAAAGVAP